ncbi:MAG TPA: ribbon-helix-helix domain-containing protein [Candidatus Nanopelagicales bacterium]|nr:ribbon-helix-helix domain-containing protein [Candidatus Nanopelagicales bacterium]
MNLRLPEELASALRELSEETGRSQQELAREALEEFVRDYRLRAYPKEVRHLITPAPTPKSEPDPEVVTLLRSIGRERLLAGLNDVRADRQ